jgi:hypothetical protein
MSRPKKNTEGAAPSAISRKEAQEKDAQEEASQDAEEDALAASPTGQIVIST